MSKKKKKNSYSEPRVIGMLNYEKKKKKDESKDILRKKRKKEEKKLRKQAQCNHIAKNTGKTYLEKVPGNDSVIRCKICGATIINDEQLLTPDLIETSILTLYSVYSHYRNKVNLSAESNAKIANAIMTNAKCVELFDFLKKKSDDEAKKIRDKKKKKKNKKKNNASFKKMGRLYSTR